MGMAACMLGTGVADGKKRSRMPHKSAQKRLCRILEIRYGLMRIRYSVQRESICMCTEMPDQPHSNAVICRAAMGLERVEARMIPPDISRKPKIKAMADCPRRRLYSNSHKTPLRAAKKRI